MILETQLPEWVNWKAQDADGIWWGYEVEPLQHFSGWYENEVGQCLRIGKGEINLQWQNTLIKTNSELK